MENSQQPIEPQSLIRFSALSILAFTMMVGILLAVLIPFVQARPAETQAVIYRTLVISAAIAFLAFTGICVYRRMIELKAGPLQMRATTIGWDKWGFVSILGPIMIVITALSLNIAVKAAELARDVEQVAQLGIDWIVLLALAIPICFLAYLFVALWWNVSPFSLEMRKHGLVTGGLRFIPWSAIKGLSWNPSTLKNVSILKVETQTQRVTFVRSSEKQTIDKLLRDQGFEPASS